MPTRTRVAMLEAVAENPIIVGGYTDGHGGVCPMLAAHRNGGRTSFASFARAWDRYTRAGTSPRRATERELRTLRTMLETSLALEDGDVLGRTIAEHRESVASRAPEPPPPGDPDRTAELRTRRGWAWLRPFRRLDDYERAVQEVEDARSERRELEPV
jgi:hypothetical protein